MSAMATRYTEFWIGAIYGGIYVSGRRPSETGPDTYNQVADENLQDLGPQTYAALEGLL